jgi:hypothetical protein
MSDGCGRFSLGGLFSLSFPLQHSLPYAETGNAHQKAVFLNHTSLYKVKGIDPLLGQYMTRRNEIRRELGGDLVLIEQDSFSKAYLDGCLIVSYDYKDSVIYRNNKSPNIKMREGSYALSAGNFYVLHLKPTAVNVERTIKVFMRPVNPLPVVDLSGADCFICSNPYDSENRRRIQVCGLPCAEGFICLECYKAYMDKTKCPICRQPGNPRLNLSLHPILEKREIGLFSLQPHPVSDIIGFLGRAYCAEKNFKLSMGVSIIRRTLCDLPQTTLISDLSGAISIPTMLEKCRENLDAIITYSNFSMFDCGRDADLLKSIKALEQNEDRRLLLLQNCGKNNDLKIDTFCRGYLKRLKEMDDEDLTLRMEKLKKSVLTNLQWYFENRSHLNFGVPHVIRHTDEKIIYL